MIDMILIGSGFIGAIITGTIANTYLKPKAFSSQELAVMAIALSGFIGGIMVADKIIQIL